MQVLGCWQPNDGTWSWWVHSRNGGCTISCRGKSPSSSNECKILLSLDPSPLKGFALNGPCEMSSAVPSPVTGGQAPLLSASADEQGLNGNADLNAPLSPVVAEEKCSGGGSTGKLTLPLPICSCSADKKRNSVVSWAIGLASFPSTRSSHWPVLI